LVALLGRLDLSLPVYRRFRDEPRVFNRLTDTLEQGSYTGNDGRVMRIACAFPTGVAAMNRFERRTDRLLDAAYSSWSSVMTMFGRDDRLDREVLTKYIALS